ncbi:MAG TPA: hypothetical protein VF812_00405 [Ktedonobacterales bacterium]
MRLLRFLSFAKPGASQPDTHGRRPAQSLATPPAGAPSSTRATGGAVYGSYTPHSPIAAPPGRSATRHGAPQFAPPAKVTQSGIASLARAWMRALSPDTWAAVHTTPHPLTLQVRRWAPIVAPAVLGSILLTLTLSLQAHERAALSPLPASAILPALLAAYLAGGALLGLGLYFAPNGVVWCLALFAGPPLLLGVMFTLAFGLPGALLVLSLAAALLLIYSVWRRSSTPAGTVEVTLLLGEWYRTLQSGDNIMLPGERLITRLSVRPRAFTTATQRVRLTPQRLAQARATVTYVVNPRAAWRTAGVRATWEDELRQRISASVRDCLDDWRYTPNGDPAARGSIARRVLDENRAWARGIGVRILSVRAHDIAVGSPQELAPQLPADAAGQRATSRVERAPATPRVMAAGPLVSMLEPDELDDLDEPNGPDDLDVNIAATSARSARASAPASAPADAPVAARTRVSPAVAAPARPAERPSPEALEDLYEAVRSRQITDTQVIRELAGHFTELARLPHAPGALPFDPVAAAQLLSQYADALDAAQESRASRAPRRRKARWY